MGQVKNENTKFHTETFTTVSQLFHELRLLAKFFVLQRHFSQATSREANLRKTRVFSFKGLMQTVFQTYLFSLTSPPLGLKQPKTHFHSKTQRFSSAIISKSSLRYVYTIFSLYLLRLCRKFQVLLYLGYFEKGLGNFQFCENCFNFLIRRCPIWFFCVCVYQLCQF